MNNKIVEFISLKNGEEEQKNVLENIKSNISFRGSNLWILACAIAIASIGLNVNSTAVIIGAMLISPLMNPIVGVGFSLAIYDLELLKKSAKYLFVATIVSLLVATTYFFLSPFKETQSELLSRTSPNIYDVLIAFIGGLVGVIALTRVEKGNPIPGVAIATALMPPLCTAGYGLAIGNYSYFFGAFYLYSINCFFICLATFLIIKFLKYKHVKSLNPKYEKHIKIGITALIFILVIPSIYLAYNLLNEKKYIQKVEQFISNEFTNKGYNIIYKNTKFNSSPKIIELAFLTKKFNSNEIDSLKQKLIKYNISNTKLEIIQDVKYLNSEKILEKDIAINNLQLELAKNQLYSSDLPAEINILFPDLKNVSFGKHLINQNTDSLIEMTVMIYQSDKNKELVDTEKIKKWLIQKLKTKNIEIIKRD